MRENELRKLIIDKCQARGIALEHLAQVSDCSITELKGYGKGLFILDTEKLTRLLQVLTVTDDELISALGIEHASVYIRGRNSNLA